ncbi:hypothetical protein ACOJA0_08695 [Corynebacterium amycolatum]|uniref:hypothetical protein n=1 Tax=Corynebacterium TaxID=1716 RepID=UPI0008A175F3|nr:hypothetical protein [Corynebacterium sp. HMSC14B06]OFT68498.1 hypothetical protein HMPREF3130_10940 [Corynebacterium sp. HMSC14B06]
MSNKHDAAGICPACSTPVNWWLNPVTSHAPGCRIGRAEDSARAADLAAIECSPAAVGGRLPRFILAHEAELLAATGRVPGRRVVVHAVRPTAITSGYLPPDRQGMPAQWLRHFEFTEKKETDK